MMSVFKDWTESDLMVKMFENDPFAKWLYKKHMESIIDRFKSEKRFPCYSVGKLTSACNRKNFYVIKDMYDGKDGDFDSMSIQRMVMGVILHDSFVMSDKAEWHLVYEDIYGHIDEYFSDAKILAEKKTTLDAIAPWKQYLNKPGGDRFKYLPGEEWENQLRYYYLLLQKGKDVKTREPANPDNEQMVKRVYVVYYTVNIDNEKPTNAEIFTPMIIPVHMTGRKWDIGTIEDELIGKKLEIETCLDEKRVPMRNMSQYRCGYCPYKVRCFSKDKDKTDDLPDEIRDMLGKRPPLAKARELKG